MMDSKTEKEFHAGSLVIEEEFTPQKFEAFLLETIFTEILCCNLSPDAMHPSRLLMTAVGKLQDLWYLAQISSQDHRFEDVRIIYLPPDLLDRLEVLL